MPAIINLIPSAMRILLHITKKSFNFFKSRVRDFEYKKVF
jgi:hypothetical protein